MKAHTPPPQSIAELSRRAEKLAGKTIGEVSQLFNIQVPQNLKVKKGWQGQFIEDCLGADSGNLSQPDFNHLGIELKTLPINLNGRVEESTYVCVLNLTEHRLLQWSQSAVCKKLSHVLWVPITRIPGSRVEQSTIATPFLWRPCEAQLQLLKNDWEEVMDLISLGKVDQLNARHGEVLQVRPKAAHSRVTTAAVGEAGETIQTLPRGFYLRSSFTQSLINSHLKIN